MLNNKDGFLAREQRLCPGFEPFKLLLLNCAVDDWPYILQAESHNVLLSFQEIWCVCHVLRGHPIVARFTFKRMAKIIWTYEPWNVRTTLLPLNTRS
jgi:hypothetical protein